MGTGLLTDYVVGIDLSLANTGWCVFSGGFPTRWGVEVTSPQDPYSKRALRLKMALESILAGCAGSVAFFVERSEWHQNLNNPNWKKTYAIEREAQWTQGLCHGIFYLWAGMNGVRYYDMPVGEWHREFGSRDKTEIARLISMQYPSEFTFTEKVNRAGRKVHVLLDRDGKVVKDHVSDAIGIASVGLSRLRGGIYD